MAREDEGSAFGRLAGETVLVVGRLHGLARTRLEALVARAGGRLLRRNSARLSLVAVAHSATAGIGDDGKLRLPFEPPAAARLVSEHDLRRRLGLLPAPGPVEGGHAEAEIARVASLPAETIRCLALFDVLEPVGDRYAYRDLLAAREVKRLLAGGTRLKAIVEAGIELGRRGKRLTDVRLTAGSSGQLFHRDGGGLAELSGQLTMPFGDEALDLDAAFAEAEAAEQDGDLGKAEALYRTLMRREQRDPVLPFNLGNVLRELGRAAEARVAWQMATARDPGFAEAWYNLALASEEEGQPDLAAAQYRRAIEARPDYGDAHLNLGLMLTRADRFAEALPIWETFLALPSRPEQAAIARRAATLCRMHLAEAGTKAG